MFTVVLPEKHRTIESYLPTGGRLMLSPNDDVCDWLADNGRSLVSIEQVGGYHCYATGTYVKRGVGFNFSEQGDALLFKLTWGGA